MHRSGLEGCQEGVKGAGGLRTALVAEALGVIAPLRGLRGVDSTETDTLAVNFDRTAADNVGRALVRP
ncbi:MULTISPECIES: hypothetical protein [unclassified Mesorhizobium]|uniref:hypothetical protein n=1 Tax=unclassified Mesorhizobium TaxID=325217 RepID=UPI00333A8F03